VSLAVSQGAMVASGEKGDSPAIHLWDIHTLKTIHVFEGDHKSDVYLMEFINQDALLVTASLRSTTPIFVYDVAARCVVFSYCVSEIVRDILPIQTLLDDGSLLNFEAPSVESPSRPWIQNFVLLTANQIVFLKHSELHSVVKQQNIRRISGFQDITCGLSFCSLPKPKESDPNTKNPKSKQPDLEQPDPQQDNLDDYADKDDDLPLFVYTGHKDGKVVLWENLMLVKEILPRDASCPIVEICLLSKSILTANQLGVIEIWSLGLETHLKSIDTKNFNLKLMSNNIKNIVRISQTWFYLNTYGGDFLKIKLDSSNEKQPSVRLVASQADGPFQNAIDSRLADGQVSKSQRTKSIKNIAMMGSLDWVAMTVVQKNEERLVFAAGVAKPDLFAGVTKPDSPEEPASFIYGFSLDTHEIIDLVTCKEIVTAMDGFVMEDVMNPLFVYGLHDTKKNKNNIGIGIRKTWATSVSANLALDLPGEIADIKFSPDNAHVVCCSKGGVVCCRLDLKNEQNPITVVSKFTGSFLPVCFNFCDRDQQIILTSEDSKHWKTSTSQVNKLEELEEKHYFNMSLASLTYYNKGTPFPVVMGQGLDFLVSGRGQVLEFWKSLKDLKADCGVKVFGHASDISKICVSHASPKDAVYTIGRSDNTIIEWKLTMDLTVNYDKLEPHRAPLEDQKIPASSPTKGTDDLIISRELNFCKKQGEKKLNQEEKSSGHTDSMALFRGSTFKDVNSLNQREDMKFDESELKYKRVPEISIELKRVYGIESFSRRKTVHFLHYYSIKDKQNQSGSRQPKHPIETKNLQLPANYLKEMLFSKYSPIPYDQKHHNCERYIAYFVSRIAIVMQCKSKESSPQRFYEGHKARISCMATHPSSSLCSRRAHRRDRRGRRRRGNPRLEHDRLLPHQEDGLRPLQRRRQHGLLLRRPLPHLRRHDRAVRPTHQQLQHPGLQLEDRSRARRGRGLQRADPRRHRGPLQPRALLDLRSEQDPDLAPQRPLALRVPSTQPASKTWRSLSRRKEPRATSPV